MKTRRSRRVKASEEAKTPIAHLFDTDENSGTIIQDLDTNSEQDTKHTEMISLNNNGRRLESSQDEEKNITFDEAIDNLQSCIDSSAANVGENNISDVDGSLSMEVLSNTEQSSDTEVLSNDEKVPLESHDHEKPVVTFNQDKEENKDSYQAAEAQNIEAAFRHDDNTVKQSDLNATTNINTDEATGDSSHDDAEKMETSEAVKEGQKDEEDEDDEEEGEETGEDIKIFSGYVPISQLSWDWEPPKPPAVTKPTPAPATTEDNRSRAGPAPWKRGRGGNYREDVVQTEHGEKARATPYIYEIKKRKFERKAKNKLFVGGLIFEATKDFLYEQFEKYGEIDDACIVTDRNTGKSRGFGYVTFVNRDDATEAIKAIDGLRINGKTLCVEFADDPKDGPPRSRSPPSRYSYDDRFPPRGRGYPRGQGRPYDVDRYPSRDPYYDRDPDFYYRGRGDDPYYGRPPPREYDRPLPRDYDRPLPRQYDRLPPREYDRPLPREYDRLPPRDYGRPPVRDYERAPPRDYDPYPPTRRSSPPRSYNDYRRTLPRAYRDDHLIPSRPQATIGDVDRARLRVDRERIRHEKHTSADIPGRMPDRRGSRHRVNKTPSSSSSSDSSDDEKFKSKKSRKASAFPSAYMS